MSDPHSPIPSAQLAPPHEPITSVAPIPEGAREAALPADGPPIVNSDMDEAAKQSFLWRAHDYLSEYARFADTKAAFSGAISGALLGVLYSAKVFVPAVSTSIRQWSGVTWLAALAGLLLCASIVLALRTVYPRLRSTGATGFVFWGNIAAFKEVDALRVSFHAQSARSLNDNLLHQAFDVSKHVCVPKYRMVSWCLITLALGALLAVGCLLLRDRTVAVVATPPALVVAAPSAP